MISTIYVRTVFRIHHAYAAQETKAIKNNKPKERKKEKYTSLCLTRRGELGSQRLLHSTMYLAGISKADDSFSPEGQALRLGRWLVISWPGNCNEVRAGA